MTRLVWNPKALAWGLPAIVVLAGALGLMVSTDFGELWRQAARPAPPQSLQNGSPAESGPATTAESRADSGWAPPAEIAAKVQMIEHRSAAKDQTIWKPPAEIAKPHSETPSASPRSE